MKKIFFAIAILPGILMACSRGESAVGEMATGSDLEAAIKTEEISDNLSPMSVESAVTNLATNAATLTADTTERLHPLMVKTASIELEVPDNKAFKDSLETMIKKKGGYIAEAGSSSSGDREEHQMKVKIPVAVFDQFIKELLAGQVTSIRSQISVEDVTASYVDIQARLQTRQLTRERYTDLLRQASKVEDILKVRHEINNIQEDIEAAQARLLQLSRSASYSSLDLTFYQSQQGLYSKGKKAGLGNRIIQAFKRGGLLFSDLIVGLVTIWPVWLGGLVLLILVWRFFGKKSRFEQPKKNEAA